MKKQVKAIPEGYQSVIPHLIVKGAIQAIEFYQKALGAQETRRVTAPDGKSLLHAEIKIGDSRIFLADEVPQMGCLGPQSIGGSPVTIHLYSEDVDASFKQAVAAGAVGKMPPTDMFWGDRYAVLADPFGHLWSFATHKEDLTDEEMNKRALDACAAAFNA